MEGLDKNICKKLATVIDEQALAEIEFHKDLCKLQGCEPISYLAKQTSEDIKNYIIKYFVVGDLWLKNWFPKLNVESLENNYKIELESKVFNKIQIFYNNCVERVGFYPGITDLRRKETSYEVYKPYIDIIKENN